MFNEAYYQHFRFNLKHLERYMLRNAQNKFIPVTYQCLHLPFNRLDSHNITGCLCAHRLKW